MGFILNISHKAVDISIRFLYNSYKEIKFAAKEQSVAVTIRSIAEKAGVSRGTVDKVLHDRAGVSQDVRDKVNRIAREMGYVPNLAGRALAYRKTPLKIGVVILNLRDDVHREILDGVMAASAELKDFGVQVSVCSMLKVTVDEQILCIRKHVKNRVAALVLSPIEDQRIRDEINRVAAMDIKVVTFNTDIQGTKRFFYYGQDVVKSGRVAAHLLAKLLPDGGNVLVASSIERLDSLEGRIRGFEQYIEENGNRLRILEIIRTDLTRSGFHKEMCEIVKRHEDRLDAVFITGPGIETVMLAVRQVAARRPKVVCYDTRTETKALVKNGWIDFTITQETFMQGYMPIRMLFEYFYQQKAPAEERNYTNLGIKVSEDL